MENSTSETIHLFRSGRVVTSLAGAFGGELRETRITAMLGYIIATEPQPFMNLFRLSGDALEVRLETHHEHKRSDILIETTTGTAIIEAKVTAQDPIKQARKYPAKWHILLTQYKPSFKKSRSRNVRYFRWRQLAELLKKLSKSKKSTVNFLAGDLLAYLEEHGMVKKRETVEVYAREINSEATLRMFLEGRMYGCPYEKSSNMDKALYFAPHFGQKVSNIHPGVQIGISYVAKIENVRVARDFNELMDIVAEERGRAWLNRSKHLLQTKRREWFKKKPQYTFLFLSRPMMVFNPPVKKERLQEGKGWLSRRFFSFEDLFAGWGC